ncbi:cyclopropane-fatty-acyl-phospholipid synthase protein [Pleurostoma richardsiae]|uniref:Cyclopropane-fatty-acyl-phospholipid synthase protein n=1 Tax=Pleurostoma richardsiae TaxID=41990 RepID=A0AA38RC19_9PEZI|nr:cyclopropane-fatty-acyl-phospholipid synthase protein [Pleurostoma richardsiae]
MLHSQLARLSRSALFSMLEKLEYGQLTIIDKAPLSGGDPQTISFGAKENVPGQPVAKLVVLDSSVWLRLCSNLDAGFAESYMLQHIEIDNLRNMFLIYINSAGVLGNGSFIFQIIPAILRLFKPTNDPARSLRNISFHYDASNDLFAGFLSPDMNYSCPIWDPAERDESLEDAQVRKVHVNIEKARISPGHHVLDIGGGWGSLALEAAKTKGCRVTATTLSREQKALFDQRIKDAGLQDRVECLVCDYRSTPKPDGGYDRIISVGMIEHVGKEHLDDYFGAISSLLNRENGIAVVQGITIINQFYKLHANIDNFIERYVFPGGYLPNVARMLNAVDTGSKGALEVESVQSIGPNYSKALRVWRENFERNWPSIRRSLEHVFSKMTESEIEAFRRKWVYYFTYCEAGFRSGILTDHIVTAVRKPETAASLGVPI